MKADGTGRSKISPQRVLDFLSVSPDGRWGVAAVPSSDEDLPMATMAIAVDGGATVPLCAGYCTLTWDNTGRYAFLFSFGELFDGSYRMPVAHDTGLPLLPANGFASAKELSNSKMDTMIPRYVESAITRPPMPTLVRIRDGIFIAFSYREHRFMDGPGHFRTGIANAVPTALSVILDRRPAFPGTGCPRQIDTAERKERARPAVST